MEIRMNYSSDEEFVSYLETRTIEQLEVALIPFLSAEMYEDCALIRDVIEFKLL